MVCEIKCYLINHGLMPSKDAMSGPRRPPEHYAILSSPLSPTEKLRVKRQRSAQLTKHCIRLDISREILRCIGGIVTFWPIELQSLKRMFLVLVTAQ